MAADYEQLGVFYLGREFDAATGKLRDEKVLYDSRDLTTHAVCMGMTGSGKTGLCLALLEEAALDGVAAICIDPKGDLGNLLLTFPELAPTQFEPWVDAGEAARKGVPVAELAASVASTWRKGLAEWEQDGDRIARLRAAADIAIYTPGADDGLPLSILSSLEARGNDGASDRAASFASSLLTLLRREADPLQNPEHTLLAAILQNAWAAGQKLDLAALIALVQKPPFDQLGAMDVESVLPAKERRALAMAINNLIAAPSFAPWTRGAPLDAQQLLFTPQGKPRIAIVSISHLSDEERMFFVTLLLDEIIAWMRRQPGTSSLRAILYMDEIFGYFPPVANPPSKPPMLTLLKQARAYGLGCVLATQNPVDLDYKGLANAGTWFIGRLQTQRDREKVLDGLAGALAGGIDRAALDSQLGALTQRVFVMRNVHEDQPVLFKSRWAMSYLRGPLTGPEIAKLMTPLHAGTPGAGAAPVSPPSASLLPASSANAAPPGSTVPPPVAPGVPQYFLAARGTDGAVEYRPRVLLSARLHFVDSGDGLDVWQTVSRLVPLDDDGAPLWDEAQVVSRQLGEQRAGLASKPAAPATFAALPSAAARADSYQAWSRQMAARLYEGEKLTLWRCDALKLTGNAGESEAEFRARCALKVREQRDAQVAKLRERFAPRLVTLQDQIRRARERSERERSQLSQQKLQTAISVGATVLGALFGRKAISASSVGRATTAARSASRIGRESTDVDRAVESETVLQQRLAELERESADAVAALQTDNSVPEVRPLQVPPRKADIAIGEAALVWTPWRRNTEGFLVPDFALA